MHVSRWMICNRDVSTYFGEVSHNRIKTINVQNSSGLFPPLKGRRILCLTKYSIDVIKLGFCLDFLAGQNTRKMIKT